MNSYSNYNSQYQEAVQEDAEGLDKFLAKEREKAYKSYPKDVEVKHCKICGEPLVYDSISYYEGFHIDSCL